MEQNPPGEADNILYYFRNYFLLKTVMKVWDLKKKVFLNYNIPTYRFAIILNISVLVLPNSAYLLPLAIVSCVFVCARSHLL
jgi:hypothetical protein